MAANAALTEIKGAEKAAATAVISVKARKWLFRRLTNRRKTIPAQFLFTAGSIWTDVFTKVPRKRHFFKAIELTLVPVECIPPGKAGPSKAALRPGRASPPVSGDRSPPKSERLPRKRQIASREGVFFSPIKAQPAAADRAPSPAAPGGPDHCYRLRAAPATSSWCPGWMGY